MQLVIVVVSAVNAFLGLKYLFNAVGILQNSKYARVTDWIFAVILLAMCAGSLYVLWIRHDERLACLLAFSPWVLVGVLVILSMIFSSYP